MDENKAITAEELEAERLEVLRLGVPHQKLAKTYFWLAVGFFLGTCLVTIILTAGSGDNAADVSPAVWVIIGIFLAAFITFYFLSAKESKIYMDYLNPFNTKYKMQFLPGILNESFDKVYAFEPQNGLSREIVEKSTIFPSFDYITTNDYLRAKHGDLKFEYCDMELQEKHVERDSDGDTRTVIKTVFTGVFIIAEFDHFVDTPLYIRNGGGHSTVLTESEAFNSQFSVHCDNAVDALRILTPETMDHILKIKEFCGSSIALAFFDDRLYFRAHLGGDRLEIAGSIDKPISESRIQVDEDLKYIKELLDLLAMRNLKSRASRRVTTDEDFAGNATYQNEHQEHGISA
jgi:hypothetical protein